MYCEREFCIQYIHKICCYTGLLYVFIETSYAVYVAAIISKYYETGGGGSRGFVAINPSFLEREF